MLLPTLSVLLLIDCGPPLSLAEGDRALPAPLTGPTPIPSLPPLGSLPPSSACRRADRLLCMAQSAASLAPMGSSFPPLRLSVWAAIAIHISACSSASCSSCDVAVSGRLDDDDDVNGARGCLPPPPPLGSPALPSPNYVPPVSGVFRGAVVIVVAPPPTPFPATGSPQCRGAVQGLFAPPPGRSRSAPEPSAGEVAEPLWRD